MLNCAVESILQTMDTRCEGRLSLLREECESLARTSVHIQVTKRTGSNNETIRAPDIRTVSGATEYYNVCDISLMILGVETLQNQPRRFMHQL